MPYNMKNIIKTLIAAVFLIAPLVTSAQITPQITSIEDLYDKIDENIRNANTALPGDCDPFGFQITVKVVAKENGVSLNILNPGAIEASVSSMLAEHNFSRFDMKTDGKKFTKDGFIYIGVGLTPVNAANESFAVYYNSYTYKESVDDQTKIYTVYVGAQFLVSTPNNGSIAGDVYYVNKDNKQALLVDRPFLSSTNEKKIAYKRMGPGNESANSGQPDNIKWFPFMQDQSNYMITSLTPGHYFPWVKINNCIQKFDNTEDNTYEETVIRTEGEFKWDNPTKNQKIVRPDKVNGSKEEDLKVYTTFSENNTIEGYLLTEGQVAGKWRDENYVKKEEIQILKANVKIFLEPYGWVSNNPRFPDDEMSKDGYYIFTNVPSGVYLVYPENKKSMGKIVSVCNCDENGKPKQANLLYQQNLGSSGYDISLDYKHSAPVNFPTNEDFNLKATWKNVVIAFGSQSTIPQKYSLFKEPNKDSLDNPLDIYGKILQPPFTIIDDPYYGACGTNYRHCNDIFKTRNAPPEDLTFAKSGEMLSNFRAEPDFEEDGLFDAIQVVDFKNDAVLPMGETVKKGIYLTWGFSFRLFAPEGDEGPNLSLSCSETFDWAIKSAEGLSKPEAIFGSGLLDARVPDDVVEKIKKGEDFTFTKVGKYATYTIRGTLNK
jgi:hypothetical protein